MLALFKYKVTYSVIGRVISNYDPGGVSSDPASQIIMRKERSDFMKKEFNSPEWWLKALIVLKRVLRKLRLIKW